MLPGSNRVSCVSSYHTCSLPSFSVLFCQLSPITFSSTLFVPPRRYRGFRDENGKFTTFYWRLLAVRLGFVILFEHVVFFICKMIDLVVPDVPESLNMKIKRERYLAKQALAEASAIPTVRTDMTER